MSGEVGSETLTVLVTNYNTSRFVELSLYALAKLTITPFKVLINDNGSDEKNLAKLRTFEKRYPFVQVYYRNIQLKTSYAHADALDFLIPKSQSKYTAILDSDCTPLMRGWDRYMIEKIDARVKIVGSPLGEGWSGTKPTDFPFQFMVLFETAAYKKLGILCVPRDIAAGEDTCWQWRPKFLEAGFGGHCFRAENTRFYKEGPFRDIRCGEYYTEDGKLIGSHFARGTSPKGKFAPKNRVLNHIAGAVNFSALAWKIQSARWIKRSRAIIDAQH